MHSHTVLSLILLPLLAASSSHPQAAATSGIATAVPSAVGSAIASSVDSAIEFAVASATVTGPIPTPTNDAPLDNQIPSKFGFCPQCNPISGLNSCDITTSCITTGNRFHCACRTGFKPADGSGFRLPFPNYEFLVFVPVDTECDTLCDNNSAFSQDLCDEVPLHSTYPV